MDDSKLVDMHAHTNYSDGDFSPEELIRLTINKRIYGNQDFNSNDIYKIAENTTKEDELFGYVDIHSYLKQANKIIFLNKKVSI